MLWGQPKIHNGLASLVAFFFDFFLPLLELVLFGSLTLDLVVGLAFLYKCKMFFYSKHYLSSSVGRARAF